MTKQQLALVTVLSTAVICGSLSNVWAADKVPAYAFGRVSCGDVHTCAIKPDGAITCWGSNAYGQAPATPPAAGVVVVVIAWLASNEQKPIVDKPQDGAPKE